jgi:hypothetical protein
MRSYERGQSERESDDSDSPLRGIDTALPASHWVPKTPQSNTEKRFDVRHSSDWTIAF